MARFYTTDRPHFVQGGIYAPPVEMMQGLLALKDKQNDEVVMGADFIKGMMDKVDHHEMDSDLVAQKRAYYSDAVEGMVRSVMENPNDYLRHMPALRKLQQEFGNDVRDGDLGRAMRNATAVNQFVENNKEGRAQDAGTYNALYASLMADWKKRRETDPKAMFQGRQMAHLPDLQDRYTKLLKEMTADMTWNTDGYYMRGTEVIEPERVQETVVNLLLSDPSVMAYMRQDHDLGGRRFFDGNGKPVSFYRMLDGNGLEVGPEEAEERRKAYNAIAAELGTLNGRSLDETGQARKKELEGVLATARRGLARGSLNPEHGFYNLIKAMDGLKSVRRDDLKTDSYGEMGVKFKYDSELLRLKQAGEMEKLSLQFRQATKTEQDKFLLELRKMCINGNETACGEYNALTFVQSYTSMNMPAASLERDRNATAITKVEDPSKPGGYAYVAEGDQATVARQRTARNKAFQSLEDVLIPIKGDGNKTVGHISAREYMQFIGDREAYDGSFIGDLLISDNMAKEFMRIKGIPLRITNTIRGTRGDSIPVSSNPTIGYLKKFGKRYNKAMEKAYESDFGEENYRRDVSNIQDPVIRGEMVSIIRGNSEDFTLLENGTKILADKDGKKILKELNSVGSTVGMIGNNHLSEVGIHLEADGKRYTVLPKNMDTGVVRMLFELGEKGMPPGSAFRNSAMYRHENSIRRQALNNRRSADGNYSVNHYLDGKNLNFVIEDTGGSPEGNVVVRDADDWYGSEPQRFDSLREFFDLREEMLRREWEKQNRNKK